MSRENTIFDTVQMKKPGYSGFDLSHEKKLSLDMGGLYPILLEEVVPGDNFKIQSEVMIRLAPLIAPVMHRVNVFVHYFFVPNRILWNQWEDFITGGRLGTTTPTMPTIAAAPDDRPPGSLYDYLGIPQGGVALDPLEINALPIWAYYKIFNDYYRDQNFQDEFAYPTDGAFVSLLQRSWEKDYFTSALPFPQRGPEVNIPISADATINYQVPVIDAGIGTNMDLDLLSDGSIVSNASTAGQITELRNIDSIAFDEINATINDLRRSSALQRWLERQARGGGRYIETLLHQFGVQSSDRRLQRAEYIGGGKQPIVISEVLNTSATETEPQGNMSGHGISTGSTNQAKYKAEEHGYIMGILSVLPRTAYQQGVPKHFLRRDKLDYYWPEFANLGEQEVLNMEIYYEGNDATDTQTFGYQQRYAEYKYAMDTVHGDFRTNLNFWHMGRIFDSAPSLNNSFVQSNPTKRIFAVDDGSHSLWAQVYNHVKARRPMPFFADPRLT